MIKNNTLVKLMRSKLIIDELEANTYPSLSDLKAKIELWLENIQVISGDIKTDISERSVKRDLQDIKQIFNLHISYSKAKNGYYIEDNSFSTKGIHEALDHFNLFFLQKNIPDANKYIRFAPRKAAGSELFFTVLKAIETKKKLAFTYAQYEKKETTTRLVSPLGLKEFKGFWYLIASDKKGIKTFGLDRISGLCTSLEKAFVPEGFDLDEYYKHCYGIVRFHGGEPQEIIIRTTPIKASYYKANPLHRSQRIMEEAQDYVIFSLFIYLTYDLQQELRSHGTDQVEVLKPEGGLEEEKYGYSLAHFHRVCSIK